MSLAIDISRVSSVLLPDGKWHDVEDHSFDLDAYEFQHEEETILGGGEVPGVPTTGARWRERAFPNAWYACPITSILALRYGEGSSQSQKSKRTR